jgi:hypothetical protein
MEPITPSTRASAHLAAAAQGGDSTDELNLLNHNNSEPSCAPPHAEKR